MVYKPEGSLVTVPELAEWMGGIWSSISETYLADVIGRLARGGILQSHRRASGGYSLARSPDQITLGDVVSLLEGTAREHCSLSPNCECPVETRCHIRRKEPVFVATFRQNADAQSLDGSDIPGR